MPDRTPPADLAATIAYLRFPLRTNDRGGLQGGSACPHCKGRRIQKWGRFAGRQRYRCRDCSRTFSTFTATPLRYLKRVHRWRAFLWCMDGRLTVRRAAAVLCVDPSTSLRWRHRLLDHWRMEPHRRLRGSVAIGELWIPQNQKGSRRLQRPPRRRGLAPGRSRTGAERVGLIAATEAARDLVWIARTHVDALRRSDFDEILAPRLAHVTEIVGYRGPLCALAGFARSVGAEYRRASWGSPPDGVPALRLALRRWLKPLRGVATRRLENYLEWFGRSSRGRVGVMCGDVPAANTSRQQSLRRRTRRGASGRPTPFRPQRRAGEGSSHRPRAGGRRSAPRA